MLRAPRKGKTYARMQRNKARGDIERRRRRRRRKNSKFCPFVKVNAHQTSIGSDAFLGNVQSDCDASVFLISLLSVETREHMA